MRRWIEPEERTVPRPTLLPVGFVLRLGFLRPLDQESVPSLVRDIHHSWDPQVGAPLRGLRDSSKRWSTAMGSTRIRGFQEIIRRVIEQT